MNVYIRIICLTFRNGKSLNNSLFYSPYSEVTEPGPLIKHLKDVYELGIFKYLIDIERVLFIPRFTEQS